MVSLRNRLDDLTSLYTNNERLRLLKQTLQLWSAISDCDISKMADQLRKGIMNSLRLFIEHRLNAVKSYWLPMKRLMK